MAADKPRLADFIGKIIKRGQTYETLQIQES